MVHKSQNSTAKKMDQAKLCTDAMGQRVQTKLNCSTWLLQHLLSSQEQRRICPGSGGLPSLAIIPSYRLHLTSFTALIPFESVHVFPP